MHLCDRKEQMDWWPWRSHIRSGAAAIDELFRNHPSKQCISKFAVGSNTVSSHQSFLFQNKEMCDIIYGSSWYLFPLADQRELLMLLMKTQRSLELWIGPMAPLNVESALKVCAMSMKPSPTAQWCPVL